MRKGSFIAKNAEGHQAEITILAFPGDVGGKLANINRWAGQIEAPIWTEDTLKNISTILEEKDAAIDAVKEFHAPFM